MKTPGIVIAAMLLSAPLLHAQGPQFTTTALPDAMSNVGYTQQVTAVMSNGPIAYSVIAGALPAGLVFSTSGLISGIPTVFGESIFTLQASNTVGVAIQRTFTLRVRNLPPEGLISWWRAENNVLDLISTNHGVLTNGATFAAGTVGQSFALDGVNDYVHIPDSPNLRPRSITLEAWAMFNSTNGPVFTKTVGPALGNSFALYLLNGTLFGFIHDINAGGVAVSSPATLSLGQWHHVAFSFDDTTKEQALYVNGVRVATLPSNRSIGYDNHPVLLGEDINNGALTFPLNGRIDEPAIYNRALSSNEIAAIYLAGSAGKLSNIPYFTSPAQLPAAARMVGYTQQVTAALGTSPITFSAPSGGLPAGLNLSSNGTISGIPLVVSTNSFVLRATDSLGAFSDQLASLRVHNLPPEGLISWWRAENNALDSISANHGALINGAAFAAGKGGQAFFFDGVNDYMNIADAANLRPASVTLEAWAAFNAASGPVIARPLGSGVGDSYIIWLLNGNLNGAFCDPNQVADILSTPFSPVPGQWYHVAFTFDNETKQQALYLDGAAVATGQSFRTIGYDNHPVLIGGDIDNGRPVFLLNGKVDEAAIYNRALTASEISAIHAQGSAGKPSNFPYFTSPAQLPDAAHMVGYTQQVTAALGTSTITFSAPSGGLPAGLNLSPNGTISGIPLVVGTNSFVLRATDSLGAFNDQLTTLRVTAPVAAPSGLISWWRGEGNALDSAGANHGTASNGVAYVAGKVGQAFGFDGINDFVWVPDATNLRPTSITLEAWAKFNGVQGPVLGRSWGSGIHNSYSIWQLPGSINGTIGDTNQAADVLSVPFAPVSGQWYHLAYTFDDVANQQAFYLNGALVASGQTQRSIGYDNHPVVIGGDIDNGTVSFLLNGGVDEAAIYDRALTAGEIAAIYNAGIAGKQLFTIIPRPMFLPPELSGTDFKLTWTAVSNTIYRVEFNPDLTPSNWITLPGDVTAVSNTASKLDALTPSNRLYRVRVLP